ncbi:sodium-translocating pyrophosphatase [Heliobacillus mobilis]|uniref:Putative K(+)-stimulated pyrophosphate-energized sodium pump n=1 Tax=Heliobacterium mobile TaxID=28064 RepID=A0A6I3SNJ2_HELMO|nr:sodium-translocating pyrophosphatase [Heliobacterium mobile]MTV50306.1 sodium-translocating pyrophosphatase [Heliobacterium mobile]
MSYPLYAAIAGVIGLLFAGYLAMSVLKEDQGTQRMKELSQAIFEGAMAFLNRQYRTLIPFAVIIFGALLYGNWGNQKLAWGQAISFLVGASFSAVAGYVGMTIATKSNARTTAAAMRGLNEALSVAFRGGAVMGMSVAGLGLLGVSVLYIVYQDAVIINSFAFGASVIALFARVGGGIYTKAADVGADLVGKVEAGIPEDDPRNPAVIADNVGDNVGDTAGMGADLYESYAATTIAAMLIGVTVFPGRLEGIFYPLLIGAAGLIAAIIASFFVRTTEDGNPQMALNKGLWGTNVLTAVATYFIAQSLFADIPASSAFPSGVPLGLTISVIAGLLVNVAIGWITEYYTSYNYKPAQHIASSSLTGPATNIIAGIGVGLKSTALPIIVIVIAIAVSYNYAGIYGIAMAAMGMLCTAGMVVAIDSFGPVADNAGGIAEMAELGPEVRKKTDKLDAVGNTTAAVAKGFAIGSAALTALALFTAFAEEVIKSPGVSSALHGGHLVLNLLEPKIIIGLFIGGTVPFLFCAFAMEAVGKAAFEMIGEVRRQFREIPGLMEGKAKPDYARCVDISTRAAIRQMIAPGLLAVITPLIVGFGFGAQALGGMLAGVTVAGVLLAIFMANAGGAWDNAKKYIESGKHGGKRTEAHSAAVIGDTVGDPFKDTAGPSLNALIKVTGTISLIIAPFLNL